MGALLAWLSSGALNSLTSSLQKAYQAKLNAETDEKKLEAEILISRLEAQRSVLIAEQGKWYTAWIRPMLAFPVVIYVWKIIVWDTVLKLGTTPDPGDIVGWIVVTTIGAYFLTRPFEKR